MRTGQERQEGERRCIQQVEAPSFKMKARARLLSWPPATHHHGTSPLTTSSFTTQKQLVYSVNWTCQTCGSKDPWTDGRTDMRRS